MKVIQLLLIIMIFSTSCANKKPVSDFDKIPLIQTELPKGMTLWGVTKYGDIKLREELSEDSDVLRFMVRGALVEIITQSKTVDLFDGKRNYWYLVKSDGLIGWIFGAYLDIHNTLQEAEKKCELMLFSAYEEKPE